MIGAGQFVAELNRAERILKDLHLLAYFNQFPNTDPSVVKALRQSANYSALYDGYLAHNAANFIFDDGALMFFRRCPEDATLLSYGYLQSPYDVIPYSTFLVEYFGVAQRDSLEAWDEYEVHRIQSPKRAHVTSMRYDWSPDLYREGAHPSAHLHIGHDSDIRVAVDAVLSPLQFLLLLVRQCYVASWEILIEQGTSAHKIASSISDKDIVPTYRKGKDHFELRLTATHGR